jgi:hypothetical protein
MEENMKNNEPIKIKLNTLLILIGILIIIGILTLLFLLNYNQKAEQYYVTGPITWEEDALYKSDIINTYEKYTEKYEDNTEVLSLLKNVVNQDFFKTKSLIVLEYCTSSRSVANEYIRNVKIKDNVANISIKQNTSTGELLIADTLKTYFIPVDSKNVTDVSTNLDSNQIFSIMSSDFGTLALVIVFIIILISIVKLQIIAISSKISEEDKKVKIKKMLMKLIIWILILSILILIRNMNAHA